VSFSVHLENEICGFEVGDNPYSRIEFELKNEKGVVQTFSQ